jgi:hypothetical protein
MQVAGTTYQVGQSGSAVQTIKNKAIGLVVVHDEAAGVEE